MAHHITNDPINAYIAQNIGKEPSVLKLELEEMGYELTNKAVRNRTYRMRKRYGEELEELPADAFSQILNQNNFEGNWEHGWLKTEEGTIFIKNNQKVDPEDFIEEIVSELKKHKPKHKTIKRKKGQYLYFVNPADLHVGKLGYEEGEYNVDIAVERCIQGVQSLTEDIVDADKIVLLIGNDIIHTDNGRSTTKGTLQDTDGIWSDNIIKAQKLYIDIIGMLLPYADLHIMYCPSNHDRFTGFMLANMLKAWYNNHKNITFDTSKEQRKYFKYHDNMIMVDHGDKVKDNLIPSLMATEQPQMWGETKFRYSFRNHKHHKIMKEHLGVIIEYSSSLSGSDEYHKDNGYISNKAIEMFKFTKNRGQRGRYTWNFTK